MTAPSPTCPRCAGTGWVWLAAEHPAPPQTVEASCPDCCAPPTHVVADWRAAHHWSPHLQACRHCSLPTHLRDDDGVAGHRLCVERAVAAESPASAEAGSSR